MILIIDAYNLLHVMPGHKKNMSDQERAQFLKKLSIYGRQKGHKMVIVFDGGPYDYPSKERGHTTEVVYSGVRETADDYIKVYLEKHRAKDLLLVSSDFELNAYANHLSIPSIDSLGFFSLLQEALRKNKPISSTPSNAVKMVSDSNWQVDELMKSTFVSTKSEDVMNNSLQSKKKQVSKQERALLQKLRKL